MKIGTFGDGWDGCERQLMEVHDGDDRCGCIRRALAADLRHLFATGRNPQLDDLDDLCPHCGATKGVCGDAGHRERSLPLHRTEAGWPRCAPPATAAAAPTARTPLSNAELNEVLRGVTGDE